ELVRMHGGEIEVASEPGRGSVFTVAIPLGRAHLPERHVVAESAPPQPASVAAFVAEAMGWLSGIEGERPGAPPRDPHTRILVVDDNADMLGYIARLLRERWAVSTATNGRQALELVRGGGFD